MQPPNARFDEIEEELASRLFVHPGQHRRALEEIFPDKSERRAYCEYCVRKAAPHLYFPDEVLGLAQFVEIADSINFLDPTARARLLPGLEWRSRPLVPIGRIDDFLYRLLPSTGNLVPQDPKPPATTHELLPATFLGLNSTVQPREPAVPANRRAANMSEQSVQSAESDDMDAPGFIFHELGELQCLKCDSDDELKESLDSDQWESTGFYVVARLSHFGRMDGVYVVYDMRPGKGGLRQQITHSAWGIPPSCPGEQFSCARIGNALGDFGVEFPLAWLDKIEHPVELVRVVRSSGGGAMRVTVDGRHD